VVVHAHPPTDEVPHTIPFRQYFTDDGLSTGSNDMIVDGSTTAVEFWIPASSTRNVFVKSISIQISDSGTVALDKFGALPELTTGISFCHLTQDVGDTVIHEGITTNLEFIRLGMATAGHGDGNTAFQADVSGSGASTYLPNMDLAQAFGTPWGVRLRKGTEDRLVFKVQDALAGLEVFNIIGYGLQL
jgi:hypothetical protein